jgi:membrane protease YdiL (CAAX protease family)
MLSLDFIIFNSDNFVSFKTESRSDNRLQSVLYGIIAYGVFIFASSAVVGILQGADIFGGSFFGSVLETLSAAVPALSDSKILTVLAWGVIIPMIETRFFFGRMLEFLAEQFKVNLSKNGFGARQIFLFSVVSAIFTVFHLTAKSGQGNVALVLTFLFGMISCFMVVYFQELKQAINLHVFSNTIAVLGKYGVNFA